MVSSSATTVNGYLASLPKERRATIDASLALVRKHLQKGFEEGMLYGMVTWFVPRSRLAETYNGQPLCYVALAAQKNYTALYLMTVYGTPREQSFRAAFAAAGKKLDMGKSCLRFRSIDDLHLPAVADAISAWNVEEYVAVYEKTREELAAGKGKGKKAVKGSAKGSTKRATAATKAAKRPATQAKVKRAAGASKTKKATKKTTGSRR